LITQLPNQGSFNTTSHIATYRKYPAEVSFSSVIDRHISFFLLKKENKKSSQTENAYAFIVKIL
jgi:hypothetical protein